MLSSDRDDSFIKLPKAFSVLFAARVRFVHMVVWLSLDNTQGAKKKLRGNAGSASGGTAGRGRGGESGGKKGGKKFLPGTKKW